MPKKKPVKQKAVAPVLHIFCEGEKTEPYYLRGYINYYHSDNKRVLVIEETNKNTPLQLVDVAIAHKAKSPEKDVFWVVFDRESVTDQSHQLHLKVFKKAKDNGIEIAFSNVCFEYWLLLHLVYTTKCYQNCDELLKQSELKSQLAKKGLKDYDKGYAHLFDKLKENDGIETAKRNAKKVKQQALNAAEHGKKSPCYLNPYTDIHELLIDIDNFVAKNPSIRSIN